MWRGRFFHLVRQAAVAMGVLALPAAIAAFAQGIPSKNQADPKAESTRATAARAREAAVRSVVQSIRDRLTQVPPELAAEAYLELVEDGVAGGPGEQREALDAAFQLAGQSPYPVRLTFLSGNLDSSDGYLGYAMDEQLDALSLRSRAAVDMLKVDRMRAREMLGVIAHPELAPRSCSGRLTYNVAVLFEAGVAVFKDGFTPQERAHGVDAEFLEVLVGGVSHASEIGPAAELLRMPLLKGDALRRAEAAFGGAVAGIHGDGQAFAVSFRDLAISVSEMAKRPEGVSRNFLEQVRTYIVNNTQGEVCSDSAFWPRTGEGDMSGSSPAGAGMQTTAAGAARTPASGGVATALALNPDDVLLKELNTVFARNQVAGVGADDLRPGGVAPPGELTLGCRSAICRRLLHEAQALNQPALPRGPDQVDSLSAHGMNTPSQPEPKSSPEWQAAAEKHLGDLRAWTDATTEPTPEDFYFQKANFLSHLLDLARANSGVYEEALVDFVSFLEQPPPNDELRIFWLWTIHSTLRATFDDAQDGPRKRHLFETVLRNNPSPVISMYAALLTLEETVHGRSAPHRAFECPGGCSSPAPSVPR